MTVIPSLAGSTRRCWPRGREADWTCRSYASCRWLIAGWLSFYQALRLAMPGRQVLLLALAPPAVFINTYCGQNGVWTAAFLGGGLCLLERRPVFAGVLFGLQAYKPHLALMIPVALLAGRQWRAFAAATVTVAALLLASIALAGLDGWRAFLDLTPVLRKVTLEDADAVWHRNVSVFMAASRLGVGLSAAYAVQIAAALISFREFSCLMRPVCPRPAPRSIKATKASSRRGQSYNAMRKRRWLGDRFRS